MFLNKNLRFLSNPFQPFLTRQPFIVLDGALATELEHRGADLRDSLWSAKILLENPDLIYQVHLDYLKAGADVITTASYQASFPGFRQKGIGQKQAEELLQLSVDLAQQAVDDFWQEPAHQHARFKPIVAASIGPYGAYLANGSEYHGNYGVSAKVLEDFHRPRIEFLAKAGADVLAFETIPSWQEAQMLNHILSNFSNLKYWLSFNCNSRSDISDGTNFAKILVELNDFENLVAVGINCTAPEYIDPLLQVAQTISHKPLMVYPNSGEIWNTEEQCWMHQPNIKSLSEQAWQWHHAGARIIGGCCRTRPEDIRALRALIQ